MGHAVSSRQDVDSCVAADLQVEPVLSTVSLMSGSLYFSMRQSVNVDPDVFAGSRAAGAGGGDGGSRVLSGGRVRSSSHHPAVPPSHVLVYSPLLPVALPWQLHVGNHDPVVHDLLGVCHYSDF